MVYNHPVSLVLVCRCSRPIAPLVLLLLLVPFCLSRHLHQLLLVLISFVPSFVSCILLSLYCCSLHFSLWILIVFGFFLLVVLVLGCFSIVCGWILWVQWVALAKSYWRTRTVESQLCLVFELCCRLLSLFFLINISLLVILILLSSCLFLEEVMKGILKHYYYYYYLHFLSFFHFHFYSCF